NLRRVSRTIIDFLAIAYVLILPEGHTQQLEQTAAFFVVVRRRDNGDFHTADLVDFIELDLGENQLFTQADRVVATSVELGRHATEVTDTRETDVDQAVEQCPHLLTAQCHLDADRAAFTQL